MVKPEEKLERNPGGGSELGARDNKAIRPGASCSDPPQPPPPSRCSLTGGGQKLRGGGGFTGIRAGEERRFGGEDGRLGAQAGRRSDRDLFLSSCFFFCESHQQRPGPRDPQRPRLLGGSDPSPAPVQNLELSWSTGGTRTRRNKQILMVR